MESRYGCLSSAAVIAKLVDSANCKPKSQHQQAAHLIESRYGCLSSSSAVWLYTTSRMTWMPALCSLKQTMRERSNSHSS
jgi:hypothetical protein